MNNLSRRAFGIGLSGATLTSMSRVGAAGATTFPTWRSFGKWLMLALEFELGADVIRSAISPSWVDIGQLAAIAGIRTFLAYFLKRDLAA